MIKIETPTPDIWLQEYEACGRADCGCRLVSRVDGHGEGSAFYYCALHAAAPDLLESAKIVLRQIEASGWYSQGQEKLRAAIARAEGEK